jgi:hypothetical protein
MMERAGDCFEVEQKSNAGHNTAHRLRLAVRRMGGGDGHVTHIISDIFPL